MKVETSLADGRRLKRKDGKAVGKKRECKRPRRRVQASSLAIQRLFETCKAVFKGPGTVPSPTHVHALQHLLDNMRAEDVGLSRDVSFFRTPSDGGTPKITFTRIYECKNFSLYIFFLPATGVIPLHNHPGMTVFSKLLLGSMHVKAYDWVDPADADRPSSSSQPRLASLKVDADFAAPCDTSVLYPTTGGNMHTFRAITPCAILDVLGPPYSAPDDRDCTYYRDHPCSAFAGGDLAAGDARYAWLEEVEMPRDLEMTPVEYRGPQIIDF